MPREDRPSPEPARRETLLALSQLDGVDDSAWLDVIAKMDEVYSQLVQDEIALEEKNAQLEQSQQFIFSLLTAMSDVLVACDENGRVISSKVFDTNPGTWHTCVVNQIGVNKRSFVMDATYDYEVWNQPICRYEYKYFNPQTMKVAKDLKSAKVTKARFTKDRFRKYRSASAASFVGVMMEVSYVAEHDPTTRATDSAANDNINTVLYKYDLELDASGRIIGGEWYTGKSHPDFLWTPPPGTRAISEAEQFATGDWTADRALPDAWQRAARRAAGSNLPLAKIVEALIRFSNR